MNGYEHLRFDRFFCQGGTVEQLERLVEDLSPQPISMDDLSLDWALDKASYQTERRAAQHLRRDGSLVYAVPLADQLALVSSNGSVTLAPKDGQAATRSTMTPDSIRRYRRDEHVDLSYVITEVRELLVTHVHFCRGMAARPHSSLGRRNIPALSLHGIRLPAYNFGRQALRQDPAVRPARTALLQRDPLLDRSVTCFHLPGCRTQLRYAALRRNGKPR